MCLWTGVSKSGFYDWKDRPLSATAVRQEYLKGKIEEIFDDNDETYGYRRVHAELVRQGEQATSELVRRLMRDLGLVPCQVRKPRSLTAQAAGIAKIPDRVGGTSRRCPLPQAHQRYHRDQDLAGKGLSGHRYRLLQQGSHRVGNGRPFPYPADNRCDKDGCEEPPSLQIVSRILTAEATIRPRLCNCSMSSGSASRSGEPAYAMTTRRPSRSSRPSRRTVYAQSIRPRKGQRDIARYIELRYNQKRLHSANGYRPPQRSAMSSESQVAARETFAAGKAGPDNNRPPNSTRGVPPRQHDSAQNLGKNQPTSGPDSGLKPTSGTTGNRIAPATVTPDSHAHDVHAAGPPPAS